MSQNSVFSFLKSGDEKKAIELLYKTAFPGVKRYLKSNRCNKQTCQDLFHDNLIKLIIKIRKKEIQDGTNLDNYLFVMVKNDWIKLVKKDKKVELKEFHDHGKEDTYHSDTQEQRERRTHIKKILSQLGNTCKQLLTLTYYLNYSLDEATAYMGFSSKDVAKTYHYRCKKKMRDLIKDDQHMKTWI